MSGNRAAYAENREKLTSLVGGEPERAAHSTAQQDTEQARRILLAERQARIAACTDEVNAVLQKHNCRLYPSTLITPEGVRPMIEIVPIE